MKASKTVSPQVGHCNDLILKAEARLEHQKRLMHSMTGTFDLGQLAEAEKLVDVMNVRLAKLRTEHAQLVSKN